VDIVWSIRSDGTELKRVRGVDGHVTGSSTVYHDSYTIPQLSTSDSGKTYHCTVIIASSPPVRAFGSVTLSTHGML